VNCGPLGVTGLDGVLMLFAGILAVGLIVGGALLVRRRRGAFVEVMAVLVIATVGFGTLVASPAVAADCVTPSPTPVNSLTIAQTSVLAGLEPGFPPVAIQGTVTNDSDDDTYIGDIEVSIAAVTLASGTVGTCSVADFVLLDPVMTVDAALAPHTTVTFAGASLGLVDQPWNQNACQNAAVELSYVALAG